MTDAFHREELTKLQDEIEVLRAENAKLKGQCIKFAQDSIDANGKARLRQYEKAEMNKNRLRELLELWQLDDQVSVNEFNSQPYRGIDAQVDFLAWRVRRMGDVLAAVLIELTPESDAERVIATLESPVKAFDGGQND